jgi:prevent-host-death family protein
MEISATLFKAECLKLLEQVENTRQPIIITKHGRAVAQLVPLPASPRSLFGYMKNTVKYTREVASPLDVEWSAISGDEDRLYARPRKGRCRRK